VKLTFETATIAEAIKAAERVAPSKGAAFDKAAGIVMEIDSTSETVCIRATNTDIFHMAWVDYVALEGEGKVTWRLPSRLFAAVLGSLPIGTGKQVTMEQKGNQLFLEQGRTKPRFNLISPDYYPSWPAFDPADLIPAPDLGGRIGLVEWAAAKSEVPISGVHFDGEKVVATDKYRLATVPMKVEGLEVPITVPAGLLGTVLKQTGEVLIGITKDQLLIMPDEYTQIRCVIYGQDYPPVDRIMENNRSHTHTVTFDKSDLLVLIDRALNFQGSDRTPTLRVFLGLEEIAVMMGNQEIGMIGDVLEVPGQCAHDRVELKFTPKNLQDILSNAPNDKVTFGYNPDKKKSLVYVDGGSGYEAWAMPRLDTGEKTA
jgi:DNA polymerase III sliding clamp (beta) subunit (PCNA family)